MIRHRARAREVSSAYVDFSSSPTRIARYANMFWRRRTVLIPLFVLALTGLIVAKSRHEFRAAIDSALSADLRWISFAVICQAAALTLIAVNYRQILARLGHRMSWRFMARAHLRRHAVATLAPLGGPRVIHIVRP